MSAELEDLLMQLERDIPSLSKDMNTFHTVFETRACQIFAVEDNERMVERLMQMLRDAGLQ